MTPDAASPPPRRRNGLGIGALVLGAIGSLGLLWLPYVLAELVPGW